MVENFVDALSIEIALWKYLPEETIMARHLKPLEAGEEGNLWKILSQEEDNTDGWLNEPDKSILLKNCYLYSFFACVDATVKTYHCVDAEEAKNLKKRRSAYMRTLKWIVKYYEMIDERGGQF